MIETIVTLIDVLMSVGYFPQAYKIYKNKFAGDISILTYIIFSTGTFIWVLYGIYLKDLPIVFSFAIGVFGSWSVLALALYYRKR
ncbi:MAG: SemiSWEET family transporter [Parcubacteria group bacterium]|nr:SemiSWEET family transporter [Parcubacteria group bacterium]MCR4343012.1 SemiSWEET family transporter [Patescibacteria group bacterium]